MPTEAQTDAVLKLTPEGANACTGTRGGARLRTALTDSHPEVGLSSSSV